MQLTRFTDYGLRTLIYLALRPDHMASIAEISARIESRKTIWSRWCIILARLG